MAERQLAAVMGNRRTSRNTIGVNATYGSHNASVISTTSRNGRKPATKSELAVTVSIAAQPSRQMIQNSRVARARASGGSGFCVVSCI